MTSIVVRDMHSLDVFVVKHSADSHTLTSSAMELMYYLRCSSQFRYIVVSLVFESFLAAVASIQWWYLVALVTITHWEMVN